MSCSTHSINQFSDKGDTVKKKVTAVKQDKKDAKQEKPEPRTMSMARALDLAKKGIGIVTHGALTLATSMHEFAESVDKGVKEQKGELAYAVQKVLSGGRKVIKQIGRTYPKASGLGKARTVK